jgi:hypothetical protein
VDAFEVWHFYAGEPLALHVAEPDGSVRTTVLGASLALGQVAHAVVPANLWKRRSRSERTRCSAARWPQPSGSRASSWRPRDGSQMLFRLNGSRPAFLQSGPARKYDVSRFTRAIVANKDSEPLFLFRNKFLNHTILFKCMILDDYSRCTPDKPISTLVYMPYDIDRPQEGGESFVFSPANFTRYCAHKLQTANMNLLAVEYDLGILKILDSLPTFSPLIVELALERNNIAIPSAYLDLTPELRVKLRAQLKGRIRPIIVAAYDRSSASVEKAVEDMTGKLFSLHDLREILPLVQALGLQHENAVEFLSSWIGITYFEYEYSTIQNHLKDFAAWLSKASYLTEHISGRDKEYIDGLLLYIKGRLSTDWKPIYALSDEYRETYSNLVYNGEIAKFSKFLLKGLSLWLRHCPHLVTNGPLEPVFSPPPTRCRSRRKQRHKPFFEMPTFSSILMIFVHSFSDFCLAWSAQKPLCVR